MFPEKICMIRGHRYNDYKYQVPNCKVLMYKVPNCKFSDVDEKFLMTMLYVK
jgi:hypothetical protein